MCPLLLWVLPYRNILPEGIFVQHAGVKLLVCDILKYFFLIFIRRQTLLFMLVVSLGGSWHEMSEQNFLGNSEKISSFCRLLNLLRDGQG